jgi:hypothetical protein
MKSGSAPKGAPQAGAAKPQTRRHLTPADRLPVQLSLFEDTATARSPRPGPDVSAGQSEEPPPARTRAPGFFAKALSGKVRPAPREPDRTHYGCSCCRWTA